MLRTRITWVSGQGAPYYSTMHWEGTTSANASTVHNRTVTFLQLFDQDINTAVDATVIGDVDQVDPATGEVVQRFNVTPVAVNSTSTGQTLPWSTQGLIRFKTGVFAGGRELRGRFFIPGFTELANLDGKVDPTGVAGFNGVLATWLAAGTAGTNLVVWSRTQGTTATVSNATIWDQWAVLRSRRN